MHGTLRVKFNYDDNMGEDVFSMGGGRWSILKGDERRSAVNR